MRLGKHHRFPNGWLPAWKRLIFLQNLLATIRDDVSDYVGKIECLDSAIHHHTQVQVERIIAYPHVAEKIAKGELLVKKAYYDVNTGKVTIEWP